MGRVGVMEGGPGHHEGAAVGVHRGGAEEPDIRIREEGGGSPGRAGEGGFYCKCRIQQKSQPGQKRSANVIVVNGGKEGCVKKSPAPG